MKDSTEDRRLLELADRAKRLSDELWKVNDRATAVRWCGDADAILLELVRAAAAIGERGERNG